jgi:hypothetical protein
MLMLLSEGGAHMNLVVMNLRVKAYGYLLRSPCCCGFGFRTTCTLTPGFYTWGAY